MSLGPAVSAIRDRVVSQFTAYRWAWANERFAEPVDEGGKPLDGSGARVPFVKIEVLGGINDMLTTGAPGNLGTYRHPGLIRAYVVVPYGASTTDAMTIADAFGDVFAYAEMGATVRSYAPSTFAGVAGYEDGDDYVLMVSVPFDYIYIA